MQSQTVVFRDAAEEWEVSYKSSSDSTRDFTYHGDVELQEFFQRPIPIKSYTWTPGTTWTTDTFDPWSLFLANSRVSNRISNYSNFSARLCVKFLINGNSFYYGRIMAYYTPLPFQDQGATIVAGVPAKSLGSQRLKMFLNPEESQGGVMKMPFIWFYDMASLTNTDTAQLGQISLLALNELKHANGSTTSVSITVYAWMEDVKLSAPTSRNPTFITAQGGADEFGDGIISAPASAVAKMSGSLSKVPVIGKFAKATSIAAGAGASIAKMFGMSRPGLIEPSMMIQPRYVGGFATTDIADPAVKLTVDSKQELTIDSGVTGVDTGDEMSLVHLAQIESYLTTFAWNVAHAPNTILFAARPNPQHYYRAGSPAYTTIPACCFVANAFKYWRGTMKYRFQVVSSGYHKGRLLIVWDPYAGTSVPEQNVQYSRIIDINSDKDFTMDIGWGQPRTWLDTQELSNGYYLSNAGTYTAAVNQYANGVLTVYVLNDLTTPNSTVNNDISVNVFVSMCDDAQFAVPVTRINTYSPWTGTGITPQAGGDLETEDTNNKPTMDETTEKMTECVPVEDASNLVYIGEVVSSFRQLIKRYNLLNTFGNLGATAGYYTWSTSDFPIGRGYYTNGTRSGTTYNYNSVNTTMLRYMSFAFVMYRGGIRNKIVAVSTGVVGNNAVLTVNRNTTFFGYSPPGLTTSATGTVAAFEDQALAFQSPGLEGLHLTPSGQQPVIEVEYPFYKNARFVACRGNYATSTYPTVDELTHRVTAYASSTPTLYHTYVAGAEDSTFTLFQGCIPFQVTPTFS